MIIEIINRTLKIIARSRRLSGKNREKNNESKSEQKPKMNLKVIPKFEVNGDQQMKIEANYQLSKDNATKDLSEMEEPHSSQTDFKPFTFSQPINEQNPILSEMLDKDITTDNSSIPVNKTVKNGMIFIFILID